MRASAGTHRHGREGYSPVGETSLTAAALLLWITRRRCVTSGVCRRLGTHRPRRAVAARPGRAVDNAEPASYSCVVQRVTPGRSALDAVVSRRTLRGGKREDPGRSEVQARVSAMSW